MGYTLLLQVVRRGYRGMWSAVTPTPDGPAPSSRSKHSATLLAGHVYLLGGRNGNLPLKDLWRYSLGEYRYTLVRSPYVAGIAESEFYKGADKSLARPGRKQATFPAFYGTWRFITTFTRVPPPVSTLAKSVNSSAHQKFDSRSLVPSLLG